MTPEQIAALMYEFGAGSLDQLVRLVGRHRHFDFSRGGARRHRHFDFSRGGGEAAPQL
jgi:hypothetical protein